MGVVDIDVIKEVLRGYEETRKAFLDDVTDPLYLSILDHVDELAVKGLKVNGGRILFNSQDLSKEFVGKRLDIRQGYLTVDRSDYVRKAHYLIVPAFSFEFPPLRSIPYEPRR